MRPAEPPSALNNNEMKLSSAHGHHSTHKAPIYQHPLYLRRRRASALLWSQYADYKAARAL